MDLEFFLATHRGSWAWQTKKRLLINYEYLINRKDLQPGTCDIFIDSGGYSQLSRFGEWTITPRKYAEGIVKLSETVGGIVAVAPQDWMCEPHVLAKTGLTASEHIMRTVVGYLDLMDILPPEIPLKPVIQGYKLNDYLFCVDLYERAGVDLTSFDYVGLGSVCKRQNTNEIGEITKTLHGMGIKLHGFGVKKQGLIRYGQYMRSSDSLAWSFWARRHPQIMAEDACTVHQNCANCLPFAEIWRSNLERNISGEDLPQYHGYIQCT